MLALLTWSEMRKTVDCSLILFLLLCGITTTSSTTTQVKTTEVKTCTEDSLTLQNGIVDRSSIGSLYWKYRFQHESKWHKIAYCKRNLRVTCKLTTEELRDGTKVSIGANESLIVKHSAQSGCRDHIKFLFEAQLTDHTVFNHIFDHFAITCVWTRIDANLNLTGIVYGTYPLEQLDEIKLFDRNGTQFAYLHPQRGATVNVTDSKRQKSVFCGRLEVASDGSLMLNGVQMTCNGTEIKSVAKLKGSVQVKFFEVFVNSTGLSTISPSQMTSSKPIKSSHITGPSSLPHSTATLYSNNLSASSISSATGKHATTTRPLISESARANVQHWTMTLTVMATFICLFLRCPEVDKKCQQEFYRILDDAFTVPKARAPVSLTCYVGLKNPR